MNKDVKKYLRDNNIKIPLTSKMAKYYLNLGYKCIVLMPVGYCIIELAERNYSINEFYVCHRSHIRHLIKELFFLHDTVFYKKSSLIDLLVSQDVKLYD